MRRGLLSLLVVLGVLIGLTAAPLEAASTWPMQGHDPLGTNANVDDRALTPVNVPRLHRIWTVPNVLTAVATDTRVYAVTSLGPLSTHRVVVLNARNGAVLRTFDRFALFRSKRAADAPQSLAYASGRLVVGSSAAIAAIDPDTGAVAWRASTGANSLTIAGGTLYTGNLCESECAAPASDALDLRTGRVLWRHQENGGAQPLLIAAHLFQIWQPNTRVYDQRTGDLLATLPLQAQWLGDGNNAFAFVSAPPALAAPVRVKAWVGRIGPAGKPAWKLQLGSPADPNGDGHAALANHTLYVPSNRFHPGVIAVDTASGKVRWGADIGSFFDLVAGSRLLFAVHRSSGAVDVLDVRGGRLLRRMAAPAGPGGGSGGIVAGGTLYVVGARQMAALRP